MLKKIRQQIAKKFGAKGGPVVEGNMAVIHDGLKATQKVEYNEFGSRSPKWAPSAPATAPC